MTTKSETREILYAGIGVRYLALLIDALILIVPGILLGIWTTGIGTFIFTLAYKTIWEASKTQATPGKRAMGLIVTDTHGHRLSPRASLIRTVMAIVSGSCFFIGHIVAFFTDKKQAVHDLLADSIVIQGETQAPLIDSWLDTARDILGSKSEIGRNA